MARDLYRTEPDGVCPGLPPRSGPRPIERLLERLGSALTYPVEAAAAAMRAGAEVYNRAESHIRPSGARIMYDALMAALGIVPDPELDRRSVRPVLLGGDIGRRFAPRLFEVAGDWPVSGAPIEILEDNSEQVLGAGGHQGARRVVRNPAAPHDATAVIFGDSFSWVDPIAPGTFGELLAATFTETHHLWSSFRADPGYLERVRPDVVIFEMAERAAVVVPPLSVDVERMAAETIAGRPPQA